ncbi:MAG: hypothetical protein WAW33_00735 [Minisyncoccia bacterium]
MVVVTDRKKRLHKQRVLKKIKFFTLLFLGLSLIGAICWAIFFSPLFEIKEIIIGGADPTQITSIQEYINQSITSHSWFFISPKLKPFLEKVSFNTKNFLWQDFSSLKSGLNQQFPEYSDSQIKFNFWRREINLTMSERVLAAIWCGENTCGLVDTNGIYFKKLELEEITSDSPYANYLILKGELKDSNTNPEVGSLILPSETIQNIANWYQGVKNSQIAFKEIILSESYLTCLKAKTISSQTEITFNPTGSVANIMLLVQNLQEKVKNNKNWQGLESLNLCFYPKIYYTPEVFFSH